MTRAELEAALSNAIAAVDRPAVELLRSEIKRMIQMERTEATFTNRRSALQALLAQYGG